MDATRGRSRPPPPPRHPPLTAAIAAISAPITSATPVAITTFRVRHHRRHRSLPTTLSRRPARAGAPWHRHHRLHRLPSTVDFEGPPLPQPSPPSPPSPLPPYWPQPPALPGVATCGKAFWPFRPQCKKNGLVTAISRAHCGVRRSHFWCYRDLTPCDISLPLLSGSRIARARLSAARQMRL